MQGYIVEAHDSNNANRVYPALHTFGQTLKTNSLMAKEVHSGRLELPWVTPHAPQACASAISPRVQVSHHRRGGGFVTEICAVASRKTKMVPGAEWVTFSFAMNESATLPEAPPLSLRERHAGLLYGALVGDALALG